MGKVSYSDAQIKFLVESKMSGFSWSEITEMYNKKFKENKTTKSIQIAYDRYGDVEFDDSITIKNMLDARRSKKTKNTVAKENRLVLDYLHDQNDLVSRLKDVVKGAKFLKPKLPKIKHDKKKNKMTMEVMLSDIHYGKKTKTVNSSVIRGRVFEYSNVVLSEIDRYNKLFNVERLILFLGGDIIENADFHGKESQIASEFGTNEQVVTAVVSIFEDFISPIAMTGIPIDIPAVTGNHDRDDERKTFNDPGRNNKTYIIYTLLKYMCELAGFTNVSFHIPDGIFCTLKIYGDTVLYEHLDYVKGGVERKTLESHIAKRSGQLGHLITYMRGGHFHELVMFGRGRIIINPSIPGQDSYSEINGYNSEASQVINYYVETENRPNSYYHSFPVYLDYK